MLSSIFIFFSLIVAITFIITTVILYDIATDNFRKEAAIIRRPTPALWFIWLACLAYLSWLLSFINPS